MNQLRNRLIAIFLFATLIPLGATVWITTSLIDRSLRLAATEELDQMSRSLVDTGRALYQHAREALRRDVERHAIEPRKLSAAEAAEVLDPEETDAYVVAGDELRYYVRRGTDVYVYTRALGVDLDRDTSQITHARMLVDRARARDLRRGFFFAVVTLAAGVWTVSMVLLVFWAHRISRPIHRLTNGLGQLAAGNLDVRLEGGGRDEVARATQAFNETAHQLKTSQERLVYLTRLASWQTLARKMAHEVKNSLTPIRLTMEELVARGSDPFISQAASIVIDEVGTLERRVRAFSEFASEPSVRLRSLDVNALVEERISLLRNAHPELTFTTRFAPERAAATADEDLIRSVLTNLLANAADAAGPRGVVLAATRVIEEQVVIEVHDSGPGLSRHALESLFQPTISFKKAGMGLGLSIARRSALLSGGDIVLIDGELGGAAFRVTLPLAKEECPPNESSSSTTKRTSVAPYA